MAKVSEFIKCGLCGGEMEREFDCRTFGERFFCADCSYGGGFDGNGSQIEKRTRFSKKMFIDSDEIVMNPYGQVMLGMYAIKPVVKGHRLKWAGFRISKRKGINTAKYVGIFKSVKEAKDKIGR